MLLDLRSAYAKRIAANIVVIAGYQATSAFDIVVDICQQTIIYIVDSNVV